MNNNFIESKELYSIVDPKEALNRGNLFGYFFWPYKYVANHKPETERESLMQKIQMYAFAAHELNLYLDIYPNDRQAIGLYNQYSEMAERFTDEYENKYGQIVLDSDEKYPWQWINSPWPWERF